MVASPVLWGNPREINSGEVHLLELKSGTLDSLGGPRALTPLHEWEQWHCSCWPVCTQLSCRRNSSFGKKGNGRQRQNYRLSQGVAVQTARQVPPPGYH